MERKEPFYVFIGNVSGFNFYGKCYQSYTKKLKVELICLSQILGTCPKATEVTSIDWSILS